jgi:hypothetical protein
MEFSEQSLQKKSEKNESIILETEYLAKVLSNIDFLNEGHLRERNTISAFAQEMDNALSSLKVYVKSIEIIYEKYTGDELTQKMKIFNDRKDETVNKYFIIPHPIIVEIERLIISESETEEDKKNYILLKEILETMILSKIDKANKLIEDSKQSKN